MIESNRSIFARLEASCAARQDPIQTSGKERFIRTTDEEKELLKHLKVGRKLSFGAQRSLIHLYSGDDHYVGLVGFDFEPAFSNGVFYENDAGFTTCILFECGTYPTATTPSIKNIVEAGSREEAGYAGHRSVDIETLFPSIQVLKIDGTLDDDATWRSFLIICAGECMQGGSWIEPALGESLVALTDLSIPSMPYAAISRSIFDADPRSLFMALYRCLEATYSYQSSKRLIDRLSLGISWQTVAEALEGELGWHPQEAMSLNEVLRNTRDTELTEICSCLRVEVSRDVRISAGQAIYALRNSIVHFRPGTREVPVEEIDWNHLCRLLVDVVFDVFTTVHVR